MRLSGVVLAIAALNIVTVANAAGENAQPAKASPAMLAAALKLPGRSSTSTYEDFLAAVSRPVRYYDFNNDGLSRSELDAVAAVRSQQTVVVTVGQLLRYDIDGDRTVTRDELASVSRIYESLNGGSISIQGQLFDKADLDHDGRVTLDEMLTLQPEQQKLMDRDIAPMATVTVDADPTPDSNFTLDDARSVVDAIFATFDLDGNGLLDPTEMRAARISG